MFAYLIGKLVSFSPTQAIIDINGIGYILCIPCSALGLLPQIGETIHFYTSFVIREFSHTMYGFLTSQEKEIFELLLNITGVGPKLALSLIGHLPLPRLKAAVSQQDLTALCRVPGVGKKTAERLMVELKDKFSHLFPDDNADLALKKSTDPKTLLMQDAMLTLINLGYNQGTAQKALKQSLKELHDEEVDLATLITIALKNV